VGETVSSRALPSLAMVCERLREMCGMNLDWRKLDFSFLGTEMWLPSSDSLRGSLLLFMRKKFLILCETWLLEPPLSCLFVDSEAPENVRFSVFSVVFVCVLAEELKSCVMVTADGNGRAAQFRGE
jgi:hypothetical protein